MDEEQFKALLSVMRAIASEEAGIAVHQRRPQANVREAIDYARHMFALPPIDEEDYDV